VRVLVRDFRHRAAHREVSGGRWLPGDVRDRASVARAAADCDVMMHCAFANWRDGRRPARHHG
jgi:nucleoside-diphosphate-sugar epimerase